MQKLQCRNFPIQRKKLITNDLQLTALAALAESICQCTRTTMKTILLISLCIAHWHSRRKFDDGFERVPAHMYQSNPAGRWGPCATLISLRFKACIGTALARFSADQLTPGPATTSRLHWMYHLSQCSQCRNLGEP